MIKEKIQAVADGLECDYHYSEKFIASLGGSNIPISYHQFLLSHQSVKIHLLYEFGSTDIGSARCSFRAKASAPEFTISTKSQLTRLFSKNKSPFSIRCKDPSFKSAISAALTSSGVLKIAQNTTFEPKITGTIEDTTYTIKTHFYLGFDEKQNAIRPILNFHQQLIDLLL